MGNCVDYERHERLLLTCVHARGQGTEVQVAFTDGCSGRVCPECDRTLRIRYQPDLAERIPGPATGLDALLLLRAAGTSQERREGEP